MAEDDNATSQHEENGLFRLLFVRSLDRHADEVWPLISSAEGLGRWLADAEIDLRPGGGFELFDPCRVKGTILSARPPFSFSWTWPHSLHVDSIVEMDLANTEGGCDLTLRQTRLPKSVLVDVAVGWHTHLDAFPAAVRGERTKFSNERAARHWRTYRGLFDETDKP